MELGEKLRQTRLAAGLSQRQLCGDTITRNMLSQIENGTAKPSMDTLRYLAQQLGKPVSFFLEEQVLQLPNRQIIEAARQATGKRVLELLEQYEGPDSVYDPERWLLEALTCLSLARQAIAEKSAYARRLLERAAIAGAKTPYYTPELERSRLVLCHQCGMEAAPLPSLDQELLLQAAAEPDSDRKRALLEAVKERASRWYCLRGALYEQEGNWRQAADCYHRAEESKEICGCLERCYRQLEDYKKAYEYACKQR